MYSDDQHRDEAIDRLRRIETKVTRLMHHSGMEPACEQIECRGERMQIPSRNVSLRDCVAALPPGAEAVDVYIEDDYVCTIFVEGPDDG